LPSKCSDIRWLAGLVFGDSTIKMTPAQASGLTSETWSLERLLQEAGRLKCRELVK
jgi:hypothetical protein